MILFSLYLTESVWVKSLVLFCNDQNIKSTLILKMAKINANKPQYTVNLCHICVCLEEFNNRTNMQQNRPIDKLVVELDYCKT